MEVRKSGYRWVILIILTLGTMLLNYSNMAFAFRGEDILAEYAMSPTMLAALTSISFLPGVFLSVPVGKLADKIGTKKVMIIFMALTAVFFLIRAFVSSYMVLFVCTLAAGICLVPTNVVPAKMLRYWFPDSEMQIAFGIYGNAPGLGTTLCSFTVFVFGAVHNTLLFIGIVAVVLCVLWAALGRNKPKYPVQANIIEEPAPQKGAMAKLLKKKDIWLICISGAVGCGAMLTANTSFVMAMQSKGMEIMEAAGINQMMNTALLIGGIASGFIVAAVKRINISFLVQNLGAILFAMAWLLPVGGHTAALIIVGSFILSGNINVNMSRISLLPLTGQVGLADLGAANGICNTAISLGGFGLPIVITAIASASGMVDFNLLIIIVMILYIVSGVLGMFVPELGPKGKLARAAAAKAEPGK